MQKLVLIVIISLIALTSSVFAHDCDIVEKGTDAAAKSYTSLYTKYQGVVPIPGFKQALINLKAYCCSQVVPQACAWEDKKNLPENYPESPYLFDHLLDITMRRLDGDKGLAYGVDPDTTALERRNKITEIANNPDGWTAKEIEDIYKEYRTPNTNTTKKIDENMTTVLKNYWKNELATLSLFDKYATLCTIIKSIYQDFKTDNKIPIGSYNGGKNFFNKCETMVKDRVIRENGYVKILMVQKSNKLLDNANKAYTKKYFVEEKMMGLRNLISKVKDTFQTIVQQAPASKSCSL